MAATKKSRQSLVKQFHKLNYAEAQKAVRMLDPAILNRLVDAVMARVEKVVAEDKSVSDSLLDQTPFDNVLVELAQEMPSKRSNPQDKSRLVMKED